MTQVVPDTICPLCGAKDARFVERIPYQRIWETLSADWGVTLSPDVLDDHTPGDATRLFECVDCGLQYFLDAVAGDARFYSELSAGSGSYYVEGKWDFHETLRLVPAGALLLDIACAAGSFLQLAARSGVQAKGIDINPVGVAQAKAKGLDVECAPLDAFSAANAGQFDVVTAFQVLEHVDDCRSFLRSAWRCVKPGGRLVLTIPNRNRCFYSDFEPLDCPPHHLTRWAERQCHKVAEVVGAKGFTVVCEQTTMADCRDLLRRRISSSKPNAFLVRLIARLVLSSVLYAVYRRSGLLARLELWRMGMLFTLEKPQSD